MTRRRLVLKLIIIFDDLELKIIKIRKGRLYDMIAEVVFYIP